MGEGGFEHPDQTGLVPGKAGGGSYAIVYFA